MRSCAVTAGVVLYRMSRLPSCRRQTASNTRLIHQTNVHRLGVQVDTAVELVLLLVESHHGPPWEWSAVASPSGATPVAYPLGRAFAREPVLLGRRPPPREAMMSINALEPTPVSAFSSAFAVDITSPAWLSLNRCTGAAKSTANHFPTKPLTISPKCK